MRLNQNKIFIINITCVATLLVAVASFGQPADGANKFLGNITQRGQVRSDFNQYWNQITAENEHTWQSVERNRDQMNWAGGDRVADYARSAGILWKFHTLVWGSQYPNWITSLSQSEQLTEITEWFDAAAARYPDVPTIDVVNTLLQAGTPIDAIGPRPTTPTGSIRIASPGTPFLILTLKMHSNKNGY